MDVESSTLWNIPIILWIIYDIPTKKIIQLKVKKIPKTFTMFNHVERPRFVKTIRIFVYLIMVAKKMSFKNSGPWPRTNFSWMKKKFVKIINPIKLVLTETNILQKFVSYATKMTKMPKSLKSNWSTNYLAIPYSKWPHSKFVQHLNTTIPKLKKKPFPVPVNGQLVIPNHLVHQGRPFGQCLLFLLLAFWLVPSS